MMVALMATWREVDIDPALLAGNATSAVWRVVFAELVVLGLGVVGGRCCEY